MSQMLPKAGGQAQSAGFSAYGNDISSQNSIGPGAPSLPQNQPPYSLNSLQQQQQLLQRQQLQQQLQQQQQQLQLQQQQQLQMVVQGASGTPILGSGGVAYRSSGGARVPTHVPKYTQMMNRERSITPSTDDEIGGRAVMQSDVSPPPADAAAAAAPPEGEVEKEISNLANAKEKTPMCLVNELARYNKVTHQYSLVDEQGPAHKKTFFVKLELGSEVYEAKGESIKKAQHAAAAKALEGTALSQPVPKAPRYVEGEGSNITPTVELNAMAMKRGEPAVYKSLDTKQQQPYAPANLDFRGIFQQRFHYGGGKPRPFFVMLKVGQREFIGEGVTRQTARHNAAAKALKVLRSLPISTEKAKVKPEDEEDDDDAMKSEISLVHEIALKRSLSVAFEVTRESGPPHMKNFVTKCLVGDLTTESEGNSKKLSKKRAAELMLEELKKLPSLPPAMLKPKIKAPNNKKKNRNIIKVQKADPSYGIGVNPISRLIQIMQANKKREPVYTLVEEKGLARRREFIMRCQVDEQMADGVGPNKKLAKRNAAEAMLQLLGYSRPSPQPTKPAIKMTSSSEGGVGGGSGSDKKVTFVDSTKPANGVKELSPSISTGCQVVPGLLRLNQSTAANMLASSPQNMVSGTEDEVSSILFKAGSKVDKQVNALAEYLKIPVTFEEFFKNQNNNTEYITRVTLATLPPHKFHGEGPTSESAKDAAALAALRYLLNVTAGEAMMKGAGDGNFVQTETLARQLNSSGDMM